MELLPDQIFCFTPKGDIVPLPRGSTPLDFAYAVHSSVGNRCAGSRVNGRTQVRVGVFLCVWGGRGERGVFG
jgi:(p)ppGpp synthase/HD superfamily hydrolase